jgi:circadian clock protein KaiB
LKTKRKSGSGPEAVGSPGDESIDLRLYVMDQTPRCLVAFENITRICDEYAPGRCRISVIDIAMNPEIARIDDISAILTLVRVPGSPGRRKLVGTLADTLKVVEALGLSGEENTSSNAGNLMSRPAKMR